MHSSITPRRRFIQIVGGMGAAMALPAFAAYPERVVRIVVPFAAGAGTDAMGRLLAKKLGEQFDTQFIVENRTGASGAIGTQHVAQSAADGHTLLLVAAPFTTVAAVLAQPTYHPLRDFTPVGMVAQGPLLWACNKDLPVSNLRELIDLARARPGKLNYASAGAGGINHLVLEMLKVHSAVDIAHIPYRGIAPATLDMISGQVQVLTGTIPALAPFVRDGRVKALAVTTARRTSALPDVPSMAESGLEGFDVKNYFGLVGPKGMPTSIVERLNTAIGKIVEMPDVQARFKSDALESAIGPATALAQFVTRDFESWQSLVAAQNLKLEKV
jgi:tripartite-type tricarboxylate transporter receptor subunit TctC